MFFISYKSQEFEQASAVKRVLEDAGMPCWMAPDSIEPGSEYGRQITDAIRNCDALVLVLSELSQTSMPVLSEVDLAMSFNKTVIPFHLDESELTDAFLFRLGIFQRIEAARDLEDAYGDLVERARKIIEERAKAEVTRAEDSHKPAPKPKRTPMQSVSLARASASEPEDQQPQEAKPLDRGRLVTKSLILFAWMMVAYALFVWLTTFEGAYDRWPTYVAIGLALVLNNNFTISLYQLFDIQEEHATGWQKRLLQPPVRPLVLLALTVPAIAVAGYTDAKSTSLYANTAATALMILLFCDYMELSKVVSAKAPKVAGHISQAVACTMFALISFVLIVLCILEPSSSSVYQFLVIAAASLCIVPVGGLVAVACNAVYRLVRGIINKAKELSA